MIIFAWVLLSFLGAFIANTKRRSFWNFFLLGMVLTPVVGVAAAALAKTDDKQFQEDQLATGQIRLCGNCRTLVRWDAAKCGECNATLEAVSPPARWDGTERRRRDRRDFLDPQRRSTDVRHSVDGVRPS